MRNSGQTLAPPVRSAILFRPEAPNASSGRIPIAKTRKSENAKNVSRRRERAETRNWSGFVPRFRTFALPRFSEANPL